MKWEDIISWLSKFEFWISIYAACVTVYEAIQVIPKWIFRWKTRNLRKVWGIKDGEKVILVCSELDDPEVRQNVEPREFIYHLKYGDVDAYVEVVHTLLRLYPNLKLRILSCGEAEKITMAFDQTTILVGGPDYNSATEYFLDKENCQFKYRSPHVKEQSSNDPEEIVIHHIPTNREFYEKTEKKDYGYFERIVNPHNPKKWILIFGGCHTIGVTSAVKALSWVPNEDGEIKNMVLPNASRIAKKIDSDSEFAVLIRGEKNNQSIHSLPIEEKNIFVK